MLQTIYVVPNRTYNFELQVTDSNGEIYRLNEGESFIFGIKEYSKGQYIFEPKRIEYTDNDDTPYIINLSVAETALLDVNKKYYYDVGLNTNNSYYPIIDYSPVVVIPYVTTKPSQ